MVKIAVKKAGGDASSRLQPEGMLDNDKNKYVWENNVKKWERKNLHEWDFEDIVDTVEVIGCFNGFPVYGYPCLKARENSVDLAVLASKDDSACIHSNGVKKLLELCLSKELAWLEKDLIFDKDFELLCSPFGKASLFKNNLITLIKNHCFGTEQYDIRTKSDFEKTLLLTKKKLSMDGGALAVLIQRIFSDYTEIQSMLKKKRMGRQSASYAETGLHLKRELTDYMHYLANNTLNYTMVLNYPRYLKAFRVRAERAFSDVGRYLSRYEAIKPYQEKSRRLLLALHSFSPQRQSSIMDFVLMVEEYKISLFAQQEVKTLFSVSQKRIDEKIRELGEI